MYYTHFNEQFVHQIEPGGDIIFLERFKLDNKHFASDLLTSDETEFFLEEKITLIAYLLHQND